jgi:hypothetical protein
MTDKELLELAAKAAGLRLFIWGAKNSENYCIKNNDGTPGDRWNPLTDDGDALRLAVKLNLRVGVADNGLNAVAFNRDIGFYTESCKGDPYAATRRAITRAAAAIGKAMP